MAILKSESGEQVEITDNTPTMDGAEQLGVSFGCRAGVCSTCVVEVVSGEENLSPKTENEESLGLEPKQRCMCQAAIKTGEVVIKW